jgi:hypothetical protein
MRGHPIIRREGTLRLLGKDEGTGITLCNFGRYGIEAIWGGAEKVVFLEKYRGQVLHYAYSTDSEAETGDILYSPRQALFNSI